MKKIVLIFACLQLLTTTLSSQTNQSAAQYIEQYKSLAITSMEEYGIPASIKLAQGLVETSNGNSRLAREANNHFGIKCKSNWTGETISHDDDSKGECFRKYGSANESYRDHSEFLSSSPRYSSLFNLDPADYKGWAKGLSTSGYATNPKYPLLLIKAIEDNELFLIDEAVLNGSMASVEPVQKEVIVEKVEEVTQTIEQPTPPAPQQHVKTKKQKKQKAPKAKKSKSSSVSTSSSLNTVVIPVPGVSSGSSSKGGGFAAVGSSISSIFGSSYVGMQMPNNVYAGPKVDANGFPIIKSSPRNVYRTNNVQFVIARDNDTFESIASEVSMSPSKLMEFNEIRGTRVEIVKGSVIYITKKASKAANGYRLHTVQKGETLHFISQKYGVKISSLAKLNGFNVNYNVMTGQRIKLL